MWLLAHGGRLWHCSKIASYLGYTGADADALEQAAHHPEPTCPSVCCDPTVLKTHRETG
jgi:hypothetical protein